MVERQRQAAHDGEAEAEALPAVLARLAPLEFVEDRVAPLLGNSRAGVPDLDRPAPVARAAADQHAAAAGVAQAVGDQVLDDPSEQQRIGRHPAPRAEMSELQPALRRRLRLLLDQRPDQAVDRKGAQIGRHDAGVELGKVEQRAQKLFERRETPVGLVDQPGLLPPHVETVERRQREPGGVQRLQQVVADGGEHGGLEEVGGLRLLLGAEQILVGALDRAQRLLHLLRAAADLVVERDRGLEQRIGARLLVVGPLDPRDQLHVDLLELGDLAPELLDFVAPVRHGAAGRLRPIATPVKVWLTCIEVYCSP